MARIARKCAKCESIDTCQTWNSTDNAAEAGALDAWTCPACAWPDAELVEAEKESAQAS